MLSFTGSHYRVHQICLSLHPMSDITSSHLNCRFSSIPVHAVPEEDWDLVVVVKEEEEEEK